MFGVQMEKSRVERYFQELHACEAERIRPAAGGWMVEGCGIQSHFYCLDDGDDDDPFEGSRDRWLTNLLFDLVFTNDREHCFQTHSKKIERPASPPKPTIQIRRHQTGGYLVFRAAIRVHHKSLILLGAPSKESKWSLLMLRISDLIDIQEDNRLKLFVDGETIVLKKLHYKQEAYHQWQFRITLEALEKISNAQQVSGVIDNHYFHVPRSGLETFRLYTHRFRKELQLKKAPLDKQGL